MFKQKSNLYTLIISIFFYSTVLISCQTTSSLEKEEREPVIQYEIEHNVFFDDSGIEGDYNYIFFRLYNPVYSNPLYPANLLKGGIKATEINGLDASHASIGFSLDDFFYGLSMGGEYQLKEEICTDISHDSYTINCDPSLSQETTYAIKVSKDEYNSIKRFVEKYAKSKSIKYKTSLNFQFAAFSVRRKFFTPENQQQFGKLKYKDDILKDRKELDPDYVENEFVCSTFIAYTLIKNVATLNQWFNEHFVNYRYVNVTDIPYIPGVKKLFTSNWDSYVIAANEFAEQNPEFKSHLNNYSNNVSITKH